MVTSLKQIYFRRMNRRGG